MRSAAVTPERDRIRWVELPGQEPPRVYVHGLGATSPAYFASVAVDPRLSGRRSLLLDLLGHGISDRPTHFDYTLESHADALANALTAAGVSAAELIAHSMGGSVAIVLAARHPHLCLPPGPDRRDPGPDPAQPGLPLPVVHGPSQDDEGRLAHSHGSPHSSVSVSVD